MKVEVICAWPRHFDAVTLELPDGATVADALEKAGQSADDVAVFGVRVALGAALHDGDRVEILRPLVADPKQARRRRAQVQRGE